MGFFDWDSKKSNWQKSLFLKNIISWRVIWNSRRMTSWELSIDFDIVGGVEKLFSHLIQIWHLQCYLALSHSLFFKFHQSKMYSVYHIIWVVNFRAHIDGMLLLLKIGVMIFSTIHSKIPLRGSCRALRYSYYLGSHRPRARADKHSSSPCLGLTIREAIRPWQTICRWR